MSGAGEDATVPQDSAPLVRVVAGDPTPEELAAVVAVLAARGAAGGGAAEDGRSRSGWTDRTRGVRAPVHPSPGGWRASAFPLPR